MDLVDSEPAPGVQEELSRFGRVLDSFSRRIQAVERRLTHTEGCQQAQELEIHEMRHVVDKVSKQEGLAKEAELSEGLVQLREQVRALIDFLAQAQSGANQRLRRVFSPPSFIPEPEKPESKEAKGADDQGPKSSKSVRVCPPAPSESDGTEKTTPQAAETMRASRASAPPASAQRSVSCGGGVPGVGTAYHSLGSRPCVRVLSGQISPAPPHLNGASTPAPTGPTPKAVALSGPYFNGLGMAPSPSQMVPMRCQRRSMPEQTAHLAPSSHSMQVRPTQMARPLPSFGVRPHYHV